MDTRKLYYDDPFLTRFQAQVLSCSSGKKGYEIILDRTAFYPEGGGQPWDTGLLGGVRVLEVHEKEGVILHYTDAPLTEGAAVEGVIDWDRRFDLMQQHSGEHIVSGLVHAAYGYDNVGFHMGSDVVTIDFNGELTWDQLMEIEQKANRYLWEDHPIEISWPGPEELHTLPYRSKKELTGAVRIVGFPGADLCACCGTHVARSGQVGLVKLLSCQKFRDGVRIELLCGGRALAHLSKIKEENDRTSTLLSAKVLDTAGAVRRLYDECQQLKERCAELESRWFTQRAGELAGAGDVLLFEEGLSPDGVRRLADAVLSVCGGRCAVFSGGDVQGYKYAVGLPGGDVRPLVKELNTALNGRGGGKPEFCQGSVQAGRAEIEVFFSAHT